MCSLNLIEIIMLEKFHRKMKSFIIANKINNQNILKIFQYYQNKETKFSTKTGILQEKKSNNPQSSGYRLKSHWQWEQCCTSTEPLSWEEASLDLQVSDSILCNMRAHCFFLTAAFVCPHKCVKEERPVLRASTVLF